MTFCPIAISSGDLSKAWDELARQREVSSKSLTQTGIRSGKKKKIERLEALTPFFHPNSLGDVVVVFRSGELTLDLSVGFSNDGAGI